MIKDTKFNLCNYLDFEIVLKNLKYKEDTVYNFFFYLLIDLDLRAKKAKFVDRP